MVSSTMPRKTKIFVGRLPENCRSDELRQLFARFGDVTECDVMNRYGFVHMAREEDAASAIKALHNSNFKGAQINVEQSTGKSRGGGPGGRRDDRRGGPMRGGRGGRDSRPGPYNDRRGGMGGGYSDYGNRGGGDYGGRGNDYGPGGGYGDRSGYGQNPGGGMGGYNAGPGMGGGYGPSAGAVGGYGPSGAGDYNRNPDYGRSAEYGGRNDYGAYPSGGAMGGDYNRGVPGLADYSRGDGFNSARAVDPYVQRNDYDRSAAGPIRNGNGGAVATGGYTTGYTDVGAISSAPPYNPSQGYSTGPQADMFSRRPVNTAASSGYSSVGGGGYAEGYERPDAYGPRGGGRRK